MTGRILCIDYGEKNIGFSISDTNFIIAFPLKNIKNKQNSFFIELSNIISTQDISEIVFGYPLNADGTKGKASEKIEKIAQKIKSKYGIKVTLWDERWTTIKAKEINKECGINEKKGKKNIDKIASSIILQDYLDNKNN